jgi:chorismate synthase
VAAGACCRALLAACGVTVSGRVTALGGVACDGQDETAAALVEQARAEGETLGGVIEVVVTGLPVGLGSHVTADRRLDARLAAAVMSVPAIKGVEFGDGFALAAMKGTATRGRMGGLTGGLTDGDALIVRAAMKPIPTTRTPQPTCDLATGQPAETVYERSDVCPVPRAVVVIEAVVCAVLADALLEKTGGDSLDDVTARVAALPKTRVLSSESKMFWP